MRSKFGNGLITGIELYRKITFQNVENDMGWLITEYGLIAGYSVCRIRIFMYRSCKILTKVKLNYNIH